MDDWCSTQVLDFDEPDSSSANDSSHKSQAAVLKVLPYKSFSETTHPVYSGVNTVGRGTECSIQIMIPSVSNNHATIEIIDDCHLISDLGSRNKTKRGKVFLKPKIKYELKFDDIITFGDVVCQYVQSTESIGDSTIESEHEVNGLASDFVLQSDSDLESDGGIGEISFPVVSETPFNALNASKISSKSSSMLTCENAGIKLDFHSDSETDIDEDVKDNSNIMKEAVKKNNNLERAETSSLNNDKVELSKVDEMKVNKGEDSSDSYNSDFETQPFPWAKKFKGKPHVSDDDTDVDDEFYNMATQKFPIGLEESDDEEMLNSETLIFIPDLDSALPKGEAENEKLVENTSIPKIEEDMNITSTSITVSESISPKLRDEKDEQENNTSTPNIEEDQNLAGTSITASDSISPKLRDEKDKQGNHTFTSKIEEVPTLSVGKGQKVENISISKIDDENKVGESVLDEAEVFEKSVVLETLKLKGKDEAVIEARRSPELVKKNKVAESVLGKAKVFEKSVVLETLKLKGKDEAVIEARRSPELVKKNKVAESVLGKAKVFEKSVVLEPSNLKLKSKNESIVEARRSPELLNTSQCIDESSLSSSVDEVNETKDSGVISSDKNDVEAPIFSSVKAADRKIAKNLDENIKLEKQSKKPERISLRSSGVISKKSGGVSTISTCETSAFTSVAGNSIASSSPKKSPIRKGKSPLKLGKSPLKLGKSPLKLVKSPLKTPKSATRNKRKSTPRKLVLTEKDEDIGDRPPRRTVIFDSSSEDEIPTKILKEKRTTRKSVAERRTESKIPEPTRKSARDIKKPVKFREEEQSSSSSSTPTSRRALKCVIRTTRKVEMKVEESESSISSTPPNPRPTKAIATPNAKNSRNATIRATRATSTPKRASKRNASVISSDSTVESLAGSGSSIDFVETTPTKRARRTISRSLKIAFTGMKTTKSLEKIVKELGGEVIDSVSECTHLVTDKIRRTCKLLCGISLGRHVVSPEWLKASKEAKRFVAEFDYLVKDEEAEEKFGFVLETSLSRAAAKILFLSNFSVHVTKSVLPPPEEMKCIVESAGGKYLSRMPSKKVKTGMTVIVCGEKDLKSCDKARKAGINIVTPEFILTGVLRQKAELTVFNT